MDYLKLLSCAVSAIMLCSCGQPPSSTPAKFEVRNDGISEFSSADEDSSAPDSPVSEVYEALNYDEQKAIWFSYIDLAEFISGKSKSEFKSGVKEALKNVSEAGFNTVYIHVRAFSDAYYNSVLYPKTQYLGTSEYDPLKIILNQAHKLGLSVHAWINPFRCLDKKTVKALPQSYKISQWANDSEYYGKYIVSIKTDEHLWLNPAYDEVRDLICSGVMEIVKNYNVDGIHFDDYFYPTTDKSFDSKAFKLSGVSDLSQWRLDNVNKMIKQIYTSIKKENKSVLFGISPQGNIENDYSFQYADVKTWCSEEGYIDYIVPQVYYGYLSTSPYIKTVERWSEMVTNKDVKLVIGLAEYKIITEDEFINNEGIIAEQIKDAKKLSNYSGIAVYNYKNLFSFAGENKDRIKSEYTFITKELKSQ